MKKCDFCGKEFNEEDLVEFNVVEDETDNPITTLHFCKKCYEPLKDMTNEDFNKLLRDFSEDLLKHWERGTKENTKVGSIIKIIQLKDEKDNSYMNKTGVVNDIDDAGQLHGSWGGLAVIPEVDTYLVLKQDSNVSEDDVAKEGQHAPKNLQKKKLNIAVLGPIGSGKTTLLKELEKKFSETFKNVVVKAEPSVTIPFITDVLNKFYNDNAAWAYTLQLCISAAQEAMFQDLRTSDYDVALFDMPFSSDIYSYSHMKHMRMTGAQHRSLVEVGSDFPFDIVIMLDEGPENIKARVSKRNKAIKEQKLDNGQDDVEVDDVSYLDSHIADFREYQEVWLSRFRSANPFLTIIDIPELPDIADPEYASIIDIIARNAPKLVARRQYQRMSIVLDKYAMKEEKESQEEKEDDLCQKRKK